MTETKENCRKQTGNLKINNKLYPIYEGLNIIGRDAKSTIILKETIFSKLHAAISVVDTNTHLICDLNSSNGTQLGKLKLVPYKFYTINDHEPIIFGDVVGMYFKGTELQYNCVVKVSSQNVDHEASTQILNNLNNTVENIHELPTQPFVADEDPNTHEAPTQIFSETHIKSIVNIHEAPTQIFPENNSESFNIHEAPTQIFPETNNIKNNIHEAETQIIPEISNKAENNIHEAETEIFPDNKSENNIHEAETQYLRPEDDPTLNENDEKITSNYDIDDSDDDATQDDLDPKIIQTCPEEVPNTQNDDDDILSRSEVYDDIFANETFRSSLEQSVAEIEEAVEVDETVLVESQKNVEPFKKPENPEIKTSNINDDEISDDDDIILSTQDSEAIDRKYREHQEELNSTMDKLEEKGMGEVSDSDATDVEDDLLLANIQNSGETSEVPETPEMTDVVNEVIVENDVNDNASDEEEIDLLASSVTKSDSCTEGSVRNDDSFIKESELAPTQLLTTEASTTTTTTTKEANNSSDDETDDELPATQLLHLIKDPKGNDTFLAPTQLLVSESTEKTSKTNDDIYLAATQKLSTDAEKNTSGKSNEEIGEMSVSLKNDNNKEEEDVFSAATQMLPSEDNSIYSAVTQLLPPENNEIDEFEAPTQILPLETELKDNPSDPETTKPKETPKNQVQNYEENVFSATTQILSLENEIQDEPEPKPAKSIKTTETDVVQNEEDNIFSAPTQLILSAENEISPQESVDSDIFLAPTQILLDDEGSMKKSDDSVRLSSESNDESMRLHLSETEPSLSNLNQEHVKLLQQQQQQNTETQLEVSFEIETQKLYIEEKTRRPDNPLSHLFADEATETEQFCDEGGGDTVDNENGDTVDNEGGDTVDNDDSDKNEDLTSIENTMKLMPIVSVVDIKKSKITMKDIQEASTSKIKKSYVKLERIRQEPTRRSNRTAKGAENEEEKVETVSNVKTTRRTAKLASNESSTPKVQNGQNEATKKVNMVNEERTSRRRTKLAWNTTSTPKITETQDKATNKENATKEEKTTRRGTIFTSSTELEIQKEIAPSTKSKEKVVETSSPIKEVKEEEEEPTKEKEGESIKKSSTKLKLPKKAEETPESSEEADFETSASRHNTRGKRRDYKSIANGGLEVESNESKNGKGRITSKSFIREKIEELEIHVKEEKLKRSAAKSIEETDSDDSVVLSKRSKRNNSKEKQKEEKVITMESTDESSIEINIRKKVPRTENSQKCESRLTRNRKQTKEVTEAEEMKESSKLGRNRKVLKNTKQTPKTRTKDNNDKMVIEIEDSDESILETHKRIMKNEEAATRKRNSEISPERSKRMPSDICLNTPNSKRRKYEPLSVNISSSQLNNDAAEHKVVFTMLNDTNLENIVRKLGGSVVDSIHSCTVLVTNKISRSLKFLIAVALGKPIVHLKWITDSEKRKKFLDPWDYLLEDTESEAKFQMSLKESLTISRKKKLLSGETILLAAAKNFSVLKEIIETSGGKCITRAPPKNTKAVVVCYEDEKSKYSRYLKQKTLIVVSAEAIFSGVLQQKLNWKQYVLS